MLVNDKLIFLQLQKTGSTFIESRIFELLPETQQLGKHYRIPHEFNIGARKVIGSIRNPWDWYLSYWSYSCLRKGGPYNRCVSKKSIFNVLKNNRSPNYHNEINIPMRKIIAHAYYELHRPIDRWHYVYEDADDPKRFRLWLNMVLSEERKYDLFQDYGISNVSSHAGIYTYLYLFLFSKNLSQLFNSNYSSEKLNLIELSVDHILKVEQLDRDFDELLKTLYNNSSYIKSVKARKSPVNTSNRSHKRNFYYDEQTYDLIKNKEQLIINRYEYDES